MHEHRRRVGFRGVVLTLAAATAVGCQAGTQPAPRAAPPAAPPTATRTGLERLSFVHLAVGQRVDASLTGIEPATAPAPSFDRVWLPDATPGFAEDVTSFTRDRKPADPRPTVVRVTYDLAGLPQPGATVTAGPGRFLRTVTATVAGPGNFTVVATQDDGTSPTITYP